MANIIITSYCNLHCPYCFANTMINTESVKNISIDQLDRILKWIGPFNEKVGLIGGEPTLHPQFAEILKHLEEYSKTAEGNPHFVLFTNGVYLDKFIQIIPKNMDILVNVNQPQAMSTEQYARMLINLQTMYKMGWLNTKETKGRVTIGCNICEQIDDYRFIWDIAKRFKISTMRMSVCAPTHPEQLADKDGYYEMMKPKFLRFVDDALKNEVNLSPDCNQIPACYFTEEEIRKVNASYVDDADCGYPKCEPVIDITPEFKASSCFGAYKLIDCDQFNSLNEMERYVHFKVMYPKILNNCGGKCEGCKLHELMQCQGGCLAFSKD